jgi:hypothetical protein
MLGICDPMSTLNPVGGGWIQLALIYQYVFVIFLMFLGMILMVIYSRFDN